MVAAPAEKGSMNEEKEVEKQSAEKRAAEKIVVEKIHELRDQIAVLLGKFCF